VKFVRSELEAVDIDLLPYNKLAGSKYACMERECVHLEGKNEE